MSSSRRRNTLKLKDKVRLLILDQKNSYSRHALAEMFGIGTTQIYRIVNDRARIMNLYHKNIMNEEFRRLDNLRGKRLVLDQSLHEWFKRLRNRNVHITGTMVKNTGQQMAELLSIEGFNASNGWLQGFISRNKLSLSKQNPDGSTDTKRKSRIPPLMETWKSKISDLIKEYDTSDIYAVDETGLFLRALPSQLPEYQTMRCSMGEMPGDRATLLLCINMKGEKENPLVISSMFKEFGKDDEVLPAIELQYEENSFMTTTIMTDWLKRFDRKMGQQGRKVVLFLDHAISHQFVDMKNVTLTFVHPNFTPSWDPMEQGVIQNFKLKYRQRILKYMISNVLKNEFIEHAYQEIDFHKVTTWISSAWEEVDTKTIRNAFSKAGFPIEHEPSCDDEAANVEGELDYAHMSRLMGIVPSNSFVEGYNLIDSNLAVEAASIDVVEIVRHFQNRSNTTSNGGGEQSSAEKSEGTASTTDKRVEKRAATLPYECEGNTSAKGCQKELGEFLLFKST